MKLIIVTVLLLATTVNMAFAACEPIKYEQIEDLEKDELAKWYCETVAVWLRAKHDDEEAIKAGKYPNGRQEGQCYKTKELLLRAYKNKSDEPLKCEGGQK